MNWPNLDLILVSIQIINSRITLVDIHSEIVLGLHKSIYWSIDHLIKYLQLHYKKNPASFNHLSEKKYVKRRCNLRFLIQRYFLWLDGTVIPQGSNGSFWWGQYTTPLVAIDFSLLWASILKIKNADMTLLFFIEYGKWYRCTHEQKFNNHYFIHGFTK